MIEVETAESVRASEAAAQWIEYDPRYGAWLLAVPTHPLRNSADLSLGDILRDVTAPPMLWPRTQMRYDRQVIGYHACERTVADRLLAGDAFRPSQNEWDWLGSGVYFWEFGHQRAYDWARQWPRLKGKQAAVVGAILQLGHCLDLLDTDYTGRLTEFAAEFVARGGTMPANVGAMRRGDCWLVNRYCEFGDVTTPIDTVRGLFQEGDPIAPGSEIRLENHIQVVVRRPHAIVGLFRPREFTEWGAPVAPTHHVGQAGVDG